jgi:hypothetical protein
MRTHLAQEFVTIRGPGVGTLTQSHHAWLHLPEVPSAVAWLDVRELNASGGTVQMGYQTAPTADETSFMALSGPTTTVPFTPSVGVTVTPLVKDFLTVPLARWFRWQITATGTFSATWDITFRLFLATHCLKPMHKRQG